MQPGDIAFKCNYATLDPDTGASVNEWAGLETALGDGSDSELSADASPAPWQVSSRAGEWTGASNLRTARGSLSADGLSITRGLTSLSVPAALCAEILCNVLDGMRLPSMPDCHINIRFATEHRCGKLYPSLAFHYVCTRFKAEVQRKEGVTHRPRHLRRCRPAWSRALR